jgi:anti-anti-sigma factor
VRRIKALRCEQGTCYAALWNDEPRYLEAAGGEADDDQADDLAGQLESAATHDPRFVTLDLAGLSFISRAALASLVGFRREQCWRGGEVWLAGLQPRVWLALHVAGLDRLFTVRDSVAGVFAC